MNSQFITRHPRDASRSRIPLVGPSPQRETVAADGDFGEARLAEKLVQRARGKTGLVRHMEISLGKRGGVPKDHVEWRDRPAWRQIRLVFEFVGGDQLSDLLQI